MMIPSNAIVIQGPYIPKRTKEVIDYYIDNNPETTVIILSTWNDNKIVEVNTLLNSSRFHLKINEMPPSLNDSINRHKQRITTYEGVKIAKSLGVKRILKVRTDSLLRIPNVCEYLHSIQERYPIRPLEGEDIRERIIVSDLYSKIIIKYGPYHVSDTWLYMHVDDAIIWYDTTRINMRFNKFIESISNETLPRIIQLFPESDFALYWMYNANIVDQSVEKFFARYFTVIDSKDVNFIHKSIPLDIAVEFLHIILHKHYLQQEGLISHSMWNSYLSKEL